LKTEAIIPYSISLVRKIMMDTPGMDKWDKTFDKHEVITELPEENGIIKEIEYLYIKFPLMMDNRDIVQQKKIWKEYNGNKNCYLSIAKSIEYPSIPPKKKIIRGEMLFDAVYLKEDKIGETKMYLINNVDLKITSMVDLVNNTAKKKPKEFIENLTKFCKKCQK
jgi:hypothetical protein